LSPPSSNSQNDKSEYKKQAEIVTDPVRVCSILRKIHDSRSLLSVTLPGVEGHFSTTLLEVSAENNCFELDELSPTSGHKQLLKIKQLRVYARLQGGVDARFNCKLKRLRKSDGYLSYVLHIPEKVDYYELRAYFRVPLSASTIIPVTLSIADYQLEVRLTDLSQGGIGLLNSDLPLEVEVGEIIPCSIALAPKEPLECEIEIRGLRSNEQMGEQRIGASFHQLTRAQKTNIAHHSSILQREWIRKCASH